MQILLTRTANRDIKSIYDYIVKQNSKAVAKNVLASIEKMIEYLADYPQIGREGYVKNTREMVVPGLPFVIVYKIYSKQIIIVAIMHTSKKWR